MAGTRLLEVSPLAGQEQDPEHWEQIHRDVVNRSVREQLKSHTDKLLQFRILQFVVVNNHGCLIVFQLIVIPLLKPSDMFEN